MAHAANDGFADLSNEHTVMEQEDSDEWLDGSDFEIFSSYFLMKTMKKKTDICCICIFNFTFNFIFNFNFWFKKMRSDDLKKCFDLHLGDSNATHFLKVLTAHTGLSKEE